MNHATKETLPEKTPFFVFDVESIGLHGQAFAVAGGVYFSDGTHKHEFNFACDRDRADGTYSDRQWVNENVPVLPSTHGRLMEMRADFWLQWNKARREYPGITMAVECGWPVEARFLNACINDDQTRGGDAPYPLHEIASYMSAAGMDPMAAYDRYDSEMPKHNPLADARQSARLLVEAIERMGETTKIRDEWRAEYTKLRDVIISAGKPVEDWNEVPEALDLQQGTVMDGVRVIEWNGRYVSVDDIAKLVGE